MSETQALLSKIAALRNRLDEAQGLAQALSQRVGQWQLAPVSEELEQRLAQGARQQAFLDTAIRQLSGDGGVEPRPAQLTARARRLLGLGRELLASLRRLAEEFELSGPGPAGRIPDDDPLAARYRATLAMADTALRMVQAYPEAPSAQLRLCDGLEATLHVVAERLAALSAEVQHRRTGRNHLQRLADLLVALETGNAPEVTAFLSLADTLLAEAKQDLPIRWYHEAPLESLPRFVAGHSLVTAQVMARLVRHDSELRLQAAEAVAAALVHDVGMLRVPVEIVAHAGTISDEERRLVESHTRLGAELLGPLGSPAGLWVDAALSHHERLDGTGYPNGLRELQIPPLVRLLAVCDIYAAFCSDRPHRPAREPRTALADTLLLADKGTLDRTQAERLLQLSFYPVGTVVELADGSFGVVVATHMSPRDAQTPARPVLKLLTDVRGRPLPLPQYRDLARGDGPNIVRALPPAEARPLVEPQR